MSDSIEYFPDNELEKYLEETDHQQFQHRHVGKCYHCNLVQQIQLIYILAAIIWLAIIYWSRLYLPNTAIVWGLLTVPLVVFGLGYYYASCIGEDIEKLMFQSNYLSFGFMITVILINWNHPGHTAGKSQFFQHIVLAFILIMLSMIDIWVSREKMSLVYHIQSILQTIALVILSISLFQYYRAISDIEKKQNK